MIIGKRGPKVEGEVGQASACQRLTMAGRKWRLAWPHESNEDRLQPVLLDSYLAERLLPTYVTRQTLLEASSVNTSEPSLATVTPTGRPHTLASSTTNPVTKSSYSPVAFPFGV